MLSKKAGSQQDAENGDRLQESGARGPGKWADLEDIGELGVAEGDMGGAGGQGVDAVPQGTQALVDELGLPQPLPLGICLAHPLTPGQVHQPQLAAPHIPCTSGCCCSFGKGVARGGWNWRGSRGCIPCTSARHCNSGCIGRRKGFAAIENEADKAPKGA